MNSLWPTEQCRQGKSANQIRNFGKRIGSKGWVGRAEVQSGSRDLTGLGGRLPSRAVGVSPDLCPVSSRGLPQLRGPRGSLRPASNS